MNKAKRGGNEKSAPAPVVRLGEWFQHTVEDPAINLVGGRARLRVIVLLACTLALDSADKAMVGAVAVELKQAMGIGNLRLAMLITAPTLVTALATLPFGIIADRINRSKYLAVSIVGWAVLMLIAGASTSYLMLLLSRLALGAAIAIAIPLVASLTGDFFPPRERGRIWGYIQAGELAGVAVGYLIAGNVAAILSWRASFWALGALSLMLAPVLWHLLPEPKRGGQSRIPVDADKVPAAGEGPGPAPELQTGDGASVDEIEQEVDAQGVQPHASLVLHEDPADMPFGKAVRYVLSIRTNVVLISSSALGYFFFGIVLTFGIVFMRNRFDLGQAAATTLSVGLGAGAILGVLIAGRLADWLIERGRINARVVVASAAFLISAVLFLPAVLAPSIAVAAPLFFLAALALGGSNPPLDAARLDIMHFRLWGRAESVRASLRYVAQALAPVTFAGLFIVLSGSGSLFSITTGHVQESSTALAYTFAIMLIPLAAAGTTLFLAMRTYPRDVATARASEQASE